MARGGRISASSSSGSSLCPLCLVPSAAALLTTRCVCVCVCVSVCVDGVHAVGSSRAGRMAE